ncbi:MAG: CRTAC1 family protein [Planctomycetota bacterium]|nr:CRTAC1 family protein [Planctomycetota bacterium]
MVTRIRSCLVIAALIVASACTGDGGHELFREVRAGVDHVHTVDLTGDFPLPEITGAGCAVFDANGDGRLDLYFTDAGRVGGKGASNKLYLRQADATYREATKASGLGDAGYGMGVAVGDIDNDGDLDVYVGNHGADALYSNNGDGTFTNVTEKAGITASEWTTSVAFLDYDNDGKLDLFVVNYVRHDLALRCFTQDGRLTYCSPKSFLSVADRLYRNRGDGTFEDVSKKAGIAALASSGLGIIVDDFNDDGWADVYVANDGKANHLWMNNKDSTFREEALAKGVAVNAHGKAEASMGVAVGDVDGDGDIDLFMTHLKEETNTLYLCEKYGFIDASMQSGLGKSSFLFTGFGTALFDIEHDGDLDLAIVNGRIHVEVGETAGNDEFQALFAEANQLFLGDGKGGFTDVSVKCGSFGAAIEVSRALGVADLDVDGDLDMVVTNCRGKVRIYENVAPKKGHWLQVRALDKALKRDVYGAVVYVHAGGRVHRRTVCPQNSYLTSGAVATHFGLGDATEIDRIEVRWPGGKLETFSSALVDAAIEVVRGEGKP